MPARDVFKMATRGGARALGLENEIGTIGKGKKADVIILDLTDPVLFPLMRENIVRQFVYYLNGSRVRTVLANGRILMEDRKVKVFDEDRIMEQAQKIGDRFVEQFTEKLSQNKARGPLFLFRSTN